MDKIFSKEKSRLSSFFSIIVIAIMLLSLLPANLFADTVDPKCYSVEEEYPFEINTSVTAAWDGHVNIELKIKNSGDQKIDNWHLTFETQYSIENIWNASILETDNYGTYTIRNNYYNQDIDIDSEVIVGMTLVLGDSEFDYLSDWYLLNTRKSEVDNDRYGECGRYTLISQVLCWEIQMLMTVWIVMIINL